MTTAKAKENEPGEILLRRWKRLVERNGTLVTLRAKEFREKPTTKRKRKAGAAVKRHHKQKRSQQLPQKLY
jgi:small subunit ribosomal protein S21